MPYVKAPLHQGPAYRGWTSFIYLSIGPTPMLMTVARWDRIPTVMLSITWTKQDVSFDQADRAQSTV